jgi:hypothetical protein
MSLGYRIGELPAGQQLIALCQLCQLDTVSAVKVLLSQFLQSGFELGPRGVPIQRRQLSQRNGTVSRKERGLNQLG